MTTPIVTADTLAQQLFPRGAATQGRKGPQSPADGRERPQGPRDITPRPRTRGTGPIGSAVCGSASTRGYRSGTSPVTGPLARLRHFSLARPPLDERPSRQRVRGSARSPPERAALLRRVVRHLVKWRLFISAVRWAGSIYVQASDAVQHMPGCSKAVRLAPEGLDVAAAAVAYDVLGPMRRHATLVTCPLGSAGETRSTTEHDATATVVRRTGTADA